MLVHIPYTADFNVMHVLKHALIHLYGKACYLFHLNQEGMSSHLNKKVCYVCCESVPFKCKACLREVAIKLTVPPCQVPTAEQTCKKMKARGGAFRLRKH